MTYRTVFDITQSGYEHWWLPVFGIIFLAIGVGLFKLRHRVRSPVLKFMMIGVPAFSLAVIIGAIALTAVQHFILAHALRTGRCEVVEGRVELFHPEPYESFSDEFFHVAGHRFHYSVYNIRAGFHQSWLHGGPIREGLLVRIHHLGNNIAKLEIAE